MRFRKLGIAAAGMALGMVVATAQAQSHRWESLQAVKPGATLIVGTGSRYRGLDYDRCRMASADAANLICMEEGRQGARLVFPAAQVEYVSRVTKPFHLWPYLLAAVGGIFLGGALSGNPTAIGIGIVGLLIGAIAGGVAAEQRGVDAVFGRPPLPDERIQLIYRKATLPFPYPAAQGPVMPVEPVGSQAPPGGR